MRVMKEPILMMMSVKRRNNFCDGIKMVVTARLKVILVRLVALASLVGLLVSCSCKMPWNVAPIQKADKKLSCRDIILEINEAEHYRSQASESRKISMSEMMMPTCWAAGYVDGEEAIQAADARIQYLGHIYDLLDCGGLDKDTGAAATQVPTPALVAPSIVRPKIEPSNVMPPASIPQAPASSSKVSEEYRRSVGNSTRTLKDENGIEYRPLYIPEQKF